MLLLGLNLLILLLSIVLGERAVPPLEAIRTALHVGNDEFAFAIRGVRLPRVLTGFLAGCGLAVSGMILQIITRNPLASPGIIGLNSGAAAAVVAVMVLVPAYPMSQLPFAAFAGAILVAALIYWLSWSNGISIIRLLLVGIGISAMAAACITYLLTLGNIFRVSQASVWMAGSLYGRTWEHFWPLLPWMAVLLPLVLLSVRQLDLFQLTDDSAKGLGLRLERMRFWFILMSVALAGSAVSMAGTIAFVGLIAPHMAVRLVGTRSIKRLPVTALLGGLIVIVADLIGRNVFSPYEIPAGLVTACIGAPYMIYLLMRRNPI